MTGVASQLTCTHKQRTSGRNRGEGWQTQLAAMGRCIERYIMASIDRLRSSEHEDVELPKSVWYTDKMNAGTAAI